MIRHLTRLYEYVVIDAGQEDNMYRFLKWRFHGFKETVNFDTHAELTEGSFSASLDASDLSPGDYDVWARACLGEVCGAASTSATPIF